MNLRVLASLFAIMPLLVTSASADIVGIQSAQTCNQIGLPSGTLTTGGVYCNTGDTGFSLTAILDGTIELPVNNSQTPSYNIVNDTGAALTSLTIYYTGTLASNADIDMQSRNPFMNWGCTSVDANGVTHSDAACGTGDITANDPASPVDLTWAEGTGGTALAAGATFNLWTASFAHAGADAGTFSGSAPDGGATLMLLGGAMVGLEALRRKFQA